MNRTGYLHILKVPPPKYVLICGELTYVYKFSDTIKRWSLIPLSFGMDWTKWLIANKQSIKKEKSNFTVEKLNKNYYCNQTIKTNITNNKHSDMVERDRQGTSALWHLSSKYNFILIMRKHQRNSKGITVYQIPTSTLQSVMVMKDSKEISSTVLRKRLKRHDS